MFYKCFKSHIFFVNNFVKINVSCFRSVRFRYCSFQKSPTFSGMTAGILIIGNEILKGTPDVNTPFLIKELNAINVEVGKVAVVPDNVDEISREVNELSSKYTYVVTSGGIGPTHDDVTYEAIAKACSDELHLNEELFKLIINYFGPESKTNPGIIKYASIPRSSVIKYIDISHKNTFLRYPIVSVRNIYMFPGVPVLLQKCFNQIKDGFMGQNKGNFSKEIFINLDEFSVTATLNTAVEKFRQYVTFGSYPTFTSNYYKIKLVLESPYDNCIEEANNFLKQNLPKGCIVDIKKDILISAISDVYTLSKISPCISSALSILEETIEKFSLSELCVCFNGDKESSALLHMFYACVQKLKPKEWCLVHFLYIRCGTIANDAEVFIQNCADLYNFSPSTIDGNLKGSISLFLRSHPNVKALLIGTAKCNPNMSTLYGSATDFDFAPAIKIMPLLNWTSSDTLFYLHQLQIPYCILYDDYS